MKQPKKTIKNLPAAEENANPDFSITISCRKSKLSEDILVSHNVMLGNMGSYSESRYPSEQGEALTTEFIKAIAKLGELIELEAKNNPLITRK